VLDEPILFEIVILVTDCLVVGVGRVELRFEVYHIVESKLSQIKFLGFNKLLLEFFDVSNQSYSSTLVQVPRFVDPHSNVLIVHEFNLIRHHIQSICFWDEFIHFRNHLLLLLYQLHLVVFDRFQHLQLLCDDTNVRDVVHYLLTLLEGIEVDLSGRLHPLEEEMRRELLLITHHGVVLFLREIVLHELTVVALSREHLTDVHLFTLTYVEVVERRVCED